MDSGLHSLAASFPEHRGASVSVLRWQGSDAELLEQLRRGDAAGVANLYDRFGEDVNRVIWRCMGADPEHDDLVQEAFVQILKSIGRVHNPESLRSWVVAVALNTARGELRKRRFRRAFWSPAPVPEVAVEEADPGARETLRRIYAIFDRLAPDDRIAFVLRVVEQRTLPEVAELCGCSLATVKRRIARASKRFAQHARRYPDLLVRMQEGTRWTTA